jgi:hypothetical protein
MNKLQMNKIRCILVLLVCSMAGTFFSSTVNAGLSEDLFDVLIDVTKNSGLESAGVGEDDPAHLTIVKAFASKVAGKLSLFLVNEIAKDAVRDELQRKIETAIFKNYTAGSLSKLGQLGKLGVDVFVGVVVDVTADVVKEALGGEINHSANYAAWSIQQVKVLWAAKKGVHYAVLEQALITGGQVYRVIELNAELNKIWDGNKEKEALLNASRIILERSSIYKRVARECTWPIKECKETVENEIRQKMNAALKIGGGIFSSDKKIFGADQFIEARISALKSSDNNKYPVAYGLIGKIQENPKTAEAYAVLAKQFVADNFYNDGSFNSNNEAGRFNIEIDRALTRTNDENKIFTDIASNNWAAQDIKILFDNNIINGFSDGEFKPKNNVSIGQFLSMATKALLYETHKITIDKYKKIDEIDFTNYVEFLNGINIDIDYSDINNYSKGTLDRPVTRGYIAKVLTLIIRSRKKLLPFDYRKSDGDWDSYSDFLSRSCIVKGKKDQDLAGHMKYAPYDKITRDELSVMLVKAIDVARGIPLKCDARKKYSLNKAASLAEMLFKDGYQKKVSAGNIGDINSLHIAGVHSGIDYRAPKGANLYAPLNSKVVVSDISNGMLVLQAKDSNVIFLHLSEIEVLLDSEIDRGELIGKIGSTLYKTNEITGSHLHIETRKTERKGSDVPGVHLDSFEPSGKIWGEVS